MLVTIWRHGEAAPGRPDRKRRLTPRGREDLARGAAAFNGEVERRGLAAPDAMLSSPWERALETANLVAGAIGCRAEGAEALVPGSDVAAVEAMLEALPAAGHRVLVSHQPLVSALTDRWLGEAGLVPPLVPGAFATLSAEVWAAGCASLLLWAAPPEYGL